jgi:hypothetical protein
MGWWLTSRGVRIGLGGGSVALRLGLGGRRWFAEDLRGWEMRGGGCRLRGGSGSRRG